MLNTINRKQVLNTDIRDCWDFFSNPLNLSDITPEWLHFRVLSELPDKMYPGLIIEYNIKPFKKVTFRWVTEITHVDKPKYFVDEQRIGPYRFWHHKHFFTETNDGVLMQDTVHYQLSFGLLGQFLHKTIIRKKIEDIFDYRYRKLNEIFNQK